MSAPRRISRKRKRLKLTPEQKKAIWAKPEANAGAGWELEVEQAGRPRQVPARGREMRTFGVRSPTPAPADVGCSIGCLAIIVLLAVAAWVDFVGWIVWKAFLQ